MKATAALLALAGLFSIQALAQDGPLRQFDWTQWLVGEWEGTTEGPQGVRPFKQSFRLSDDGHYVLTEVQFGEGKTAFRGFGVFQYFPAADSAYGNFFGMDGITNDGWAKRFDDRMVWHLQRGSRTTTRIRERLGDDAYVVHNYSVRADGTMYQTTERLKRMR